MIYAPSRASRSRPGLGTGRAGLNPPLQKGEAVGMPELIEKLRFILFKIPKEINQILRAYAKISSHFRIPSSEHLCLRLNLKILKILPWQDYPCGFAQSEQPILA